MDERVRYILRNVQGTPDFVGVVFDSINATNAFGDNALHVVCGWGDLEAAKILVENGINVNQFGELGYTPLKWAERKGFSDIAEYLLANGADPAAIQAEETFDQEKWDLHMQQLDEQMEEMEKQFAEGCGVSGEAGDKGEMTVEGQLFDAVTEGRIDEVRALIAKGVDVNLKNDDGMRLIMYAWEPDTMRVLLAAGADVHARGWDGSTALSRGSAERAKLLLDHGADIDAVDLGGITALMSACSGWSNLEKIRLLIERGANMEVRDRQGLTALHYAAKWCSEPYCAQLVEFLIGKGIDVNARTRRGKSALDLAVERGNQHIAAVLRRVTC